MRKSAKHRKKAGKCMYTRPRAAEQQKRKPTHHSNMYALRPGETKQAIQQIILKAIM